MRSVDLGKIEFPEGAEHLLLNRWGAPWKQQIDLIGVEARVQGNLLEAQNLTNFADLKNQALLLNARAGVAEAELEAQAIVIQARAKAQARILEGQSEGEARAAG